MSWRVTSRARVLASGVPIVLMLLPLVSDAVTFTSGTHTIDAANSFPDEGVVATGSTTINVLVGGVIGGVLSLRDSSGTTMSGGSVRFDLQASNDSIVSVSGGDIGFDLVARGDSVVAFSGGSIGRDLEVFDHSEVVMTGGTVGSDLEAFDGSTVTVEGGTIWFDIIAFEDSSIEIVGEGFAIDGIPVEFGRIRARFGNLTGTLRSGDPIDNFFCHKDCAFFGGASGLISLPEPHSSLLLLSALLMLIALRRLERHPRKQDRGDERLFYVPGDGDNGSSSGSVFVFAAPEPSTHALHMSALAAIGSLARRRSARGQRRWAA